MCGIAGFFDFDRLTSETTLEHMTSSLAHRGPDDAGTWMAHLEGVRVGLGHRRLSILDLRPEAAQPMHHGPYTIVFNGEIYNFKEVREILSHKGHAFETQSDTEVILHAYEEWGLECVKEFIGMFAFVVVDEKRRKAIIVRDRSGVKPLYVWRGVGLICFASELKALFQHPKFSPTLDMLSVSRYFDYGFIPSGASIFEHVEKLLPGHYMTIDLVSRQTETHSYWSVRNWFPREPRKRRYENCLEEFTIKLLTACRYRTVSDVPVGVFLSGGYDSAAVLASLKMLEGEPVKAFTIGFETGNNEVPQAAEIARHLGVDHYSYICREADAKAIIPRLPYIYDEPFADSSAIPTTLVSQFASEQVKVVLSADGGDEVFHGYKSYEQLGRRMAKLSRIPQKARQRIAEMLIVVSDSLPQTYIQKKHMLKGLGYALHRNDSCMALRLHYVGKQLPEVYSHALFRGFDRGQVELDLVDTHQSNITQAAVWDYENYLVDDILVKVDRATMSASIEGREPLLDHKLAEFAAAMPAEFKMFGSSQKRILKDFVHNSVPKSIMDGPKRGFSVPVLKWLKGDLSYLIDEHLNPAALHESGIFRELSVARVVNEFKAGRLHYETLIWKILMFQMWHRTWMQKT